MGRILNKSDEKVREICSVLSLSFYVTWKNSLMFISLKKKKDVCMYLERGRGRGRE